MGYRLTKNLKHFIWQCHSKLSIIKIYSFKYLTGYGNTVNDLYLTNVALSVDKIFSMMFLPETTSTLYKCGARIILVFIPLPFIPVL